MRRGETESEAVVAGAVVEPGERLEEAFDQLGGDHLGE